MLSLLNRYATPLTTGLFIVSLVSGVALFFHVGPGGFHGMHEWLSIALIVPFVLHIWRNWRPFLNYFKRLPMVLALGESVVAAGFFLMPVGSVESGGRPPQFALSHMVLEGSVCDVAPLLGLDASGLQSSLEAAGFSVASPDETLLEVAQASGKAEMDIAGVLVSLPAH
ncbi:DUF4405 domain-containing protein [Aliiruegeria lutimaris]|uniref:Uncharacterized protein n=1 Tax=Aliiruegeria lutimaris TaxID=571298 RepID=A0A1G8IHW0_9RHOB|nr:DUF4405 domain-containing protein [Aliiruegeria lutimaris]SDI18387.1 hypothetical protein SAMN04488026_100139 [Aliiruegeria lutimaris]